MARRRSLSINEKTFAVFAVSFICLIAALHWLTSHFLLGGFSVVEERETRVNVARVKAALQDSVARLNTTTGDWAGWDQAYTFMQGRNPTYVRDSLTPESIGGIGIEFLVFLKPSGSIYYGTGYDAASNSLRPLPRGLLRHLEPGNPVLKQNRVTGQRSGLLVLPRGIWMIASRPILTSKKTGPVRGTLIMGKRVDRNEISRLSNLTELSFTLQSRPGMQAVGTVPGYIAVEPLTDSITVGETALTDIYGKPTVQLEVNAPRFTWRQGQESLRYVLLTMISLCFACGAVSLWVIERLVLRRIRILSDQVRAVSSSSDFSRRVTFPGLPRDSGVRPSDELGTLARAVNELLATVERSGRELAQSEIRFRTFMDNSPAVAFIKDEDGKVVYVNAAYERRLGLKSEDIVGKTDFDVWPQETAEQLWKNDRQVLRDGVAVQVEETIQLPTGPSDWLTFKFPLVDSDGRSLLAGMAVDITERKAMEKMKSEFVSVVSHELRTPVTSIRGALGLVLGGVVGVVPEKTRELLQVACNNSDRLTQLLNDILDMQKIESGKMTLDLKRQDLSALVTQSLTMNAAYAHEYQVEFVHVSQLPGVLVDVDADRFLQVMANLLSNAAKFSGSGKEIHISETPRPDNFVRVSVTNFGPPIPREFHHRIFTRFAQADASSTRSKGGTGLGLSISRAIVERMGGSIGFESSAEAGTTFYFDLPLHRTAET